jgi:hypothetical protein
LRKGDVPELRRMERDIEVRRARFEPGKLPCVS